MESTLVFLNINYSDAKNWCLKNSKFIIGSDFREWKNRKI